MAGREDLAPRTAPTGHASRDTSCHRRLAPNQLSTRWPKQQPPQKSNVGQTWVPPSALQIACLVTIDFSDDRCVLRALLETIHRPPPAGKTAIKHRAARRPRSPA